MNKWKKIATLDINYHQETFREFSNWIMTHVPEGTDADDILLNFEAHVNDDYNLYGEKYLNAESTLTVSIRNKSNEK